MYLLVLKLEERSVRPLSFRKILNHAVRTQRDRCIPQVALQSPKESSFVKLYESCVVPNVDGSRDEGVGDKDEETEG